MGFYTPIYCYLCEVNTLMNDSETKLKRLIEFGYNLKVLCTEL